MIKVKVGSKEYDVKFHYSRLTLAGQHTVGLINKHLMKLGQEIHRSVPSLAGEFHSFAERVNDEIGEKDKSLPDQKLPHDTTVIIYEAGKQTIVAQGKALLHSVDVGKFQYRLGRKVALKSAIAQTGWSRPEKKTFWDQMMPYIKDNG